MLACQNFSKVAQRTPRLFQVSSRPRVVRGDSALTGSIDVAGQQVRAGCTRRASERGLGPAQPTIEPPITEGCSGFRGKQNQKQRRVRKEDFGNSSFFFCFIKA